MNFSLDDLRTLSGMTRRTIFRWQRDGIIARLPGGGRRPQYSWSTALGCSLAGALIRAGVVSSVAARVIEWCESGKLHRGVMSGHHHLVCTRRQAFLVRDGALFATEQGEDVVAITIDLPRAIRTFHAAVEKETAAVAASN